MTLRFHEGAASARPIPLTIRSLFESQAASASGQTIVYRDKISLTYGEFRERVAKLANVLEGLGVEEGTAVAVLDWDSHRYLEAYFAVPMMGAVLQTVNVRLSSSQILYTLQHAGAEVVLVHSDFLDLIESMRSALPRVRRFILLDDEGAAPPADWLCGEYERLLQRADAKRLFRDFDENAIATTFYTTGTTGVPKGVCFSHRQIVLHTLAMIAPFGSTRDGWLGAEDVYMPLTPMFHVHAWGFPYVATLLGVKQVYPGRYEPVSIVALKRAECVTFSHCVPTVLQMVVTAATQGGIQFDDWLMIIGGSAITEGLAQEAEAIGISILAGYGMSETGPVVSIARSNVSGGARIGHLRSGVPIPLVTARVVDDEMNDVPADDTTVGELVVRSPWLTTGYLEDPDASDLLWRGGWLHTQDIATISGDGSIQIRDRLKDVIKSGGEWISSLLMEDILRSSPRVSDVAVVGVPDPKWQERPAALVVPTSEGEPDLDELNALLRASADAGMISSWAMLVRVEVAPGLPLTSVGKVDKKAIRNAFA